MQQAYEKQCAAKFAHGRRQRKKRGGGVADAMKSCPIRKGKPRPLRKRKRSSSTTPSSLGKCSFSSPLSSTPTHTPPPPPSSTLYSSFGRRAHTSHYPCDAPAIRPRAATRRHAAFKRACCALSWSSRQQTNSQRGCTIVLRSSRVDATATIFTSMGQASCQSVLRSALVKNALMETIIMEYTYLLILSMKLIRLGAPPQ